MIEVTRKTDHTYIGFVFKEDGCDNLMIGVWIDGEMKFVDVTNRFDEHKTLKRNEGYVAIVDFLDGTETVDYYYAELNKMENILVWYYNIYKFELFENKPMREHLESLYLKPKEYFDHLKKLLFLDDSAKKINEYKNFDKKWVETHLKP